MSIYNYNHFNIHNSNPPVSNNSGGQTAQQRVQNNVNRVNNYGNTNNGIETVTERAFNRVEIDPFRAVQARAREIKNDVGYNNNSTSQLALDEFRELMTGGGLYASKFIASNPAQASLWQQRNNTVDSSLYINPAVVQQYRQSIEQNYPVSSFLAGGANSSQVQSDMQVLSPEMAAGMELVAQQQGSTQAQRQFARFYSRPGVKTYKKLFNSGETFRGVYFQFQNNDLVNQLLHGPTNYEILTQQLDRQAFEASDNTRINILAGNELMIGVGNQSPDRNVYGVQSSSSFHPKVGYIPDKNSTGTMTYRLAFIGSQNITSALSNNRTVESLLVFDSNSSFVTEQNVGQEVATYTDFLLGQAQEARHNNRAFIAEQINFRNAQLANRKYLYLQGGINRETEIQTRYYNLIDQVANNRQANDGKHKLVISMSEFTDAGFIGTQGAAARTNLLKLAEDGRLVLALNSETITRAIESPDDNLRHFYNELARRGALRIVPTTKLHEKSISIFDDSNKLVAYAVGSANFTNNALGGNNVEASAIFGTSIYADANRQKQLNIQEQREQDQNVRAYLGAIQGIDDNGNLTRSAFQAHTEFLTGGKFNIRPNDQAQINKADILYSTGYIAERPSKYSAEENQRIERIRQLRADIERYNVSATTGVGTVRVSYRYAPDTRAHLTGANMEVPDALQPVGLRVEVQSPEGHHKVALDMTVNTEGDVIMSDLNKNISQSLYVNTTNEDQVLFQQAAEPSDGLRVNRRVIRAGESVQLNSFETTLGFINTLQRQFVYQSEYAQTSVYFMRLNAEAPMDARQIAKNVLAKQFADLVPHYQRMTDANGNNVTANLESIIYDISNRARSDQKQALLAQVTDLMVSRKMGSERSIFNPDPRLRGIALQDLFNQLSDRMQSPLTQQESTQLAEDLSRTFVDLLDVDSANGVDALADIRKEFIFSHEGYIRTDYIAMAKTQSRAFVSDLMSPFMSAHESTYGGYQAKARLPVYGEDTNFEHNYGVHADFFRQGFLNPLAYGHSTRLGRAGKYYRQLGSSSVGEPLKAPHLGGLRQLTIVDSDISEGAGVVYDNDILAKSVTTLNVISKSDFMSSLTRQGLVLSNPNARRRVDKMFKRKGSLRANATDEEIAAAEDVSLMYSSFQKAERLTQRIKNIVGSRPAIDINRKWLSQGMGQFIKDKSFYDYYGLDMPDAPTQGRVSDEANDIVSGAMRISLSTAQMQKVREARVMLANSAGHNNPDLISWAQVQKYFREQLLNQNLSEHGIIGPEELKRVALATGVNMLSDPNDLNAGYKLISGKVQRVRNKVNVNRLDDSTGSRQKLAYILGRQGIVTTRSFEQDGQVYKAGYYIKNEQNEIQQVADYTDDGFLSFRDIYEIKSSPFGQTKEAFTFKMPAFSERAEGGFTKVLATPNLAQTARDMDIFEFDTITINRTDTGNRPSAEDGLPKGPFAVRKKNWFDRLDNEFINNAYDPRTNNKAEFESLMNYKGEAQYSQTTFAFMSPKNFKGYAIKGGVSMVGSVIDESTNAPSSFKTLYEQQGLEVAKSLSFMFLGDDQVRHYLGEHYNDDPIKKMAITRKGDKVDISNSRSAKVGTYSFGSQPDERASALAISASGFLGLQGDASDLQLQGLKQLVIDALKGDLTAQNTLRERSQRLLLTARESGESYTERIDMGNGAYKLRKQVQLNDQDGVVRAAGIYATMVLFKTQVLGQKDTAQKLAGDSSFTYNEMPLNLVEFYHGFKLEKDSTTGHITRTNYDSTIEGYTREQYRNTLNMVQGHLGRDLKNLDRYFDSNGEIIGQSKDELYEAYLHNQYLMQTLESTSGRGQALYMNVDMSISQSLVPAGMKDSVKFEYSSYLALSDKRLRLFRDPLGLGDNQHATNVQQAYFGLVGLLDQNIYAVNRDDFASKASFKLPFIGDATSNYGTLPNTSQIRQQGYNVFNDYDEIDLLSVAAIYSKGKIGQYTRRAVQEVIKLSDARAQGLANASTIPNVTNYIRDLLINEGARPSGTTYADGTDVELKGVNQMLDVRFNRGTAGNQERDYIAGIVEVQGALLKEIELERSKTGQARPNTERYRKLLRLYNNVHTSKSILIPNLSLELNPTADGNRVAKIQPFSADSVPAIAMLLGGDMLGKLSLVFGDHSSEIITTQMSFMHKFLEAQPLLERLSQARGTNGLVISDAEYNTYSNLRQAAQATYAAVQGIFKTDVTRQAFGDHEGFKGAVGIPVNTNLLNPWEIALGERMLRLAGQTGKPELARLIDRFAYKSVTKKDTFEQTRLADSEYRALTDVINTYTVRTTQDSQGNYINHSVTAANTQSLMNLNLGNVDENIRQQNRLEALYNQVFREATGRSVLRTIHGATTTGRREFSVFEQKLLTTARLYSQVLDLGDNTEDKILLELLKDSMDIQRKSASLPNTWHEARLSITDDLKNIDPKYTMDRLVELSLGIISQRTGHPGGASAAINEKDNYQATTVDLMNARQAGFAERTDKYTKGAYQNQAQFSIDPNRMSAGMVVPSISRFISMLGDYDGDSHRIITNKTDKLLAKITKSSERRDSYRQQAETLRRVDNIASLDSAPKRQRNAEKILHSVLQQVRYRRSDDKTEALIAAQQAITSQKEELAYSKQITAQAQESMLREKTQLARLRGDRRTALTHLDSDRDNLNQEINRLRRQGVTAQDLDRLDINNSDKQKILGLLAAKEAAIQDVRLTQGDYDVLLRERLETVRARHRSRDLLNQDRQAARTRSAQKRIHAEIARLDLAEADAKSGLILADRLRMINDEYDPNIRTSLNQARTNQNRLYYSQEQILKRELDKTGVSQAQLDVDLSYDTQDIVFKQLQNLYAAQNAIRQGVLTGQVNTVLDDMENVTGSLTRDLWESEEDFRARKLTEIRQSPDLVTDFTSRLIENVYANRSLISQEIDTHITSIQEARGVDDITKQQLIAELESQRQQYLEIPALVQSFSKPGTSILEGGTSQKDFTDYLTNPNNPRVSLGINYDNFEYQSNYSFVDKLAELNNLRSTANIINREYLDNLDFTATTVANIPDPDDSNIIRQVNLSNLQENLNVLVGLADTGRAMFNADLRRARAMPTELRGIQNLAQEIYSDTALRTELDSTFNIEASNATYLGDNTYERLDTYINKNDLIRADRVGYYANVASTLRDTAFTDGASTNFTNYLEQMSQLEDLGRIDNFDQMGKHELSVQVGLFEHQSKIFSDLQRQALELEESSTARTNAMRLLRLEQERLLRQQGIVGENIESYMRTNYGGEGVEETYNNFIEQIQGDSRLIAHSMDLKAAEEDEQFERYRELFGRLSDSRNIAESKKMDDLRQFFKMYTGLPDFMLDARGQNSEMDNGELASLMAQKFSLDGIADHGDSGASKTRLARTGLFAQLIEQRFERGDTFNTAHLDRLANLDVINNVADRDYVQDILDDLKTTTSQLAPDSTNRHALTTKSMQEANYSEDIITRTDATGQLFDMNNQPVTRDEIELRGFAQNLRAMGSDLRKLGIDDTSSREDVLRRSYDLYGSLYNMNSTFDLIGDMTRKASGKTLDPFEFESSIRSIGKGGSELIGEAYNSLIPLLDQQTMAAPFMSPSQGQANMFRSYIRDLSSPEQIEAAKRVAGQLGVDLSIANIQNPDDIDQQLFSTVASTEEILESRQRMKTRFYSGVGVVTAFQQIVRDALKPPGGSGGILELFGERAFTLPERSADGTERKRMANLNEILSWTDDNYSPEQQNEKRQDAMKQFLGLMLGTNLTENYDDATFGATVGQNMAAKAGLAGNDKAVEWFQSIDNRAWVQNITGFGALMMLKDYTTTKDGDFHSKFIKNSESIYGYTEQEYKDWVDNNQAQGSTLYDEESTAKQFVKTRIIDLMQRTQAGFSAESIRSKGADSPTKLVERALHAYEQSGLANAPDTLQGEFNGYAGILQAYKIMREDSNSAYYQDETVKRNIDYTVMKNILKRKLEIEQSSTGAFDANSIEYLRDVKQDLMTIQKSENGVDLTVTQAMSINAINSSIMRLRRGKMTDMLEAQTMAQFNLQQMSDILSKADFDPYQLLLDSNGQPAQGTYTAEQRKAGAIFTGLVHGLGLENQDDKRVLIDMLMSTETYTDRDGTQKTRLRYETFAEDASSVVTLKNIIKASEASASTPEEQWNAAHQQLNNVVENIFGDTYDQSMGVLPTDRVRDLIDPGSSYDEAINNLERQRSFLLEDMTRANNPVLREVDTINYRQGNMRANYGAEVAGIIASPLIFALAGSKDMKLDERVAALSIDALQGLAEASAYSTSATSQHLSNYSEQAQGFKRARVRQSLATEGLRAGIVQGLGQELMYRGIMGMTQGIMNQTLGRAARNNMHIGTIGSAIVSEVIGSVLAQGVSKSLFQVKGSRHAQPVQSPITKMIDQYVEEVWKAAEEAQLQLIDAEYIVMDTDHNMQLDFEMSASPSESWWDIETGILIMDDSGSALESEFEEQDSGYLETAGTSRLAT